MNISLGSCSALVLVEALVEILNQCLEAIFEWIQANNPDKMKVLLVGGRFDLGFKMSPILELVALCLKEQVYSLGMLLEPGLLLDKQVEAWGKMAFHQI